MDMQTPTTEPSRRPRSSAPLPELPPPSKISLANQACWYAGILTLATGLVGFVVPGLFYMHLNPVHNLILAVSGAIAFWFGLTSPNYTAKRFSLWFGGVYLLFGIAGFAFGHRAMSLTRPTASGMPEESSFLWRLVPNHFELGTADHILHILIGAVFLIAGYFTLKTMKRPVKEKITWH